MKELNQLYDALQKRRQERQAYRVTKHLPTAVARDAGLEVDHITGRTYRL
ncbi:hypothetical protein [Oceanibium sediminis]|nr:hypothetical protein [Oceanibium sediminis]